MTESGNGFIVNSSKRFDDLMEAKHEEEKNCIDDGAPSFGGSPGIAVGAAQDDAYRAVVQRRE
ncbi:hypothetical protein SPIRO4BDMA_50641 [uncultured spirochete]|uniref:Uncharacterized protein n=1 Tax=uncultured spirochete TaxID=156406 RepID=A0A3P3XS46_9SPIR|nr:hypothetical protein SPIRO4BDMA_50641 [uncultured spirochete]